MKLFIIFITCMILYLKFSKAKWNFLTHFFSIVLPRILLPWYYLLHKLFPVKKWVYKLTSSIFRKAVVHKRNQLLRTYIYQFLFSNFFEIYSNQVSFILYTTWLFLERERANTLNKWTSRLTFPNNDSEHKLGRFSNKWYWKNTGWTSKSTSHVSLGIFLYYY